MKPTIIINGEKKEMQKVKARAWREVMAFDDKRKTFPVAEGVEEYCRIIALAFGVTVDEVLDNLNLDDVVPKYFEVLNAVVSMLTEKLSKKNEPAAEQI